MVMGSVSVGRVPWEIVGVVEGDESSGKRGVDG